MTETGQLHQVAITGRVFGEDNQVISLLLLGLGVINRSIDDVHLIADNRLDPCPLAQLQQLDGAIHDPMVGQGQGWHAQLFGTLNHGRQLGRAVQQAVIAVVVERYKCHSHSLGPDARSSVSTRAPTQDLVAT